MPDLSRRVTLIGRAAAACAAMLVASCATYQPWVNPPMEPVPAVTVAPYRSAIGAPREGDDIYFVVSFSGGGMRAAALGYGILEALRGITFDRSGRPATLLDQVDVLSGVSGGSVPAAYFAAFGERTFTEFKDRFLLHDVEADLVSAAMAPGNSYRLSSPMFGRGNLLSDQLDAQLFHGVTFERLARRPALFITATDLSLGSGFEFTQDQLRLLCTDLRDIPLSVAVAASSAVPIVLSPITLRNHASACGGNALAQPASDAPRRVQRYFEEQRTYGDQALRPYIHLVDGSLSDNLGLRRLAEDLEMAGGLGAALERGGARNVRKVVFLSVNAERSNTFEADRSGSVPSPVAIFEAVKSGLLSRNTRDTYDYFAETLGGWRREMRASIAEGRGPFAPGAEIYDISVELASTPDAAVRKELLALPTTLALGPAQVDKVIAAAGEILRGDPEFQRLVRDLGATVRPSGL